MRTSQPQLHILTQVVWTLFMEYFSTLSIWLDSHDLRMSRRPWVKVQMDEARLNKSGNIRSRLAAFPKSRPSRDRISNANPMTYEANSTLSQTIEDEISELETRLRAARAILRNARQGQL